MSNAAFIMSGNLHIAPIVAGVTGAFSEVLNPTEFKYTPPSNDPLKLKSYLKDTWGQTIATKDRIGDPAKLSFGFNLIPKSLWDLIWMGDLSALTQASGTDVAFTLTAKSGKWVPIGTHRQLSAIDITTPTGLVEGDDYQIDYAAGLFYAVPGGEIADAATVSGTYDHAAITGIKVAGGKYSAKKCAVRISGKDEYSGDHVQIEAWEADLVVSEFSPIGDDFVTVSVEGELVTPSGKTAPIAIEAWTPPA